MTAAVRVINLRELTQVCLDRLTNKPRIQKLDVGTLTHFLLNMGFKTEGVIPPAKVTDDTVLEDRLFPMIVGLEGERVFEISYFSDNNREIIKITFR